MGEKKGSIVGLIEAMCSAVRTWHGPAGFGMTITSSRQLVVAMFGRSTDCKILFTSLKLVATHATVTMVDTSMRADE